MDLEKLYVRAARAAARHRRHVADLPVAGTASREDAWEAFGGRLPDGPTSPGKVLDELLAAADGHLVGTVGPRYFGFVIGGSTPAATAADMLAVGWDQNAFNPLMSPAAEAAERAAGGWVKDLLGLPAARPSVSSLARRPPTRSASPAGGTGCWSRPATTSRPTGSSGPRESGSSRASSGTPPSTGRCGCSGWARRRWWACSPTTTAPSTSTTWRACWRPNRSGRRSSASRRAT